MSMAQAITYVPGDVVSSNFEPGIVIGSYFASFSGCLLTIELLHRRGTALGSWRSWLETLECAVAMGVVGIWCMHFIGNRAITLGDGSANLQLIYAPGFTTLSVFLPVIGLTGAFAAAEYRTARPLHHWVALSVTGIIAGLSIVGMHYVGNLGVSNYTMIYSHKFLAAAFVIAEGDCLLVLALFYTWREAWISSWWKRLFCASFLAGGVSSMHFTASVGCKYVFRHYSKNERQRDIQVIIAGSLCGAAVITFLAYLFLRRQKASTQRKSAQKVILACATFSPEGKLLVNTDGTLPSREITDRYNSTGFADDFNTAHSVLHWIFRVTYNWAGVSDLVPKMRSHLISQREHREVEEQPISAASSAIYDPSTYSDYSVIFRERFCVAASNLATSMNIPLEQVGVLYDRVVQTGTLHETATLTRDSRLMPDVEMGARRIIIGKGQVLFVVRNVDSTDADKLLNAGYRFAPVSNVARTIADSLQIPVAVLESHCLELQRYIYALQNIDKSGTWLTLFAPIPKAHGGGFDLAVNKSDQNQLPDTQLLRTSPQPWQHEFLALMDGLKPQACLRLMEKRLAMNEVETKHSLNERGFARAVTSAIQNLAGNVPSEWFQQAHFVAKARQAHYSQVVGAPSAPTIIYSFVVMADMHTAIDAYDKIARVPMSFFSMRQRCYAGSPDHQVLARDIHAEFGPLLGRKISRDKAGARFRIPSMSSHRKQQSTVAQTYFPERSTSYTDTDTSSENGLVDKVEPVAVTSMPMPMSMPNRNESIHGRDNVWGGILVNSETTVKTDSTIGLNPSDIRMNEFGAQAGLGLQTAVGTAKQEDTFVEALLSDTRAKFLPPKPGY